MDLPECIETDNGVLLSITARPKSSRNAITGVHANRLKIAITEAPEKGKANTAIVKLLARALGIARRQIQLHSGATSTRKQFLITEIKVDGLISRMKQILAQDS